MWAAGSLTPAAGGLQVARVVYTNFPAVVVDLVPGVVSAPFRAVAETKEWWAVWWSVRNVKNPGALLLETATGGNTVLSVYNIEYSTVAQLIKYLDQNISLFLKNSE